MGMYTGLRMKGRLKSEAVPIIKLLLEPNSSWDKVLSQLPNSSQFKIDAWINFSRCNFIPFGAIAYLPWNEEDPEWKLSLVGNKFTFQCSLKNYENEIEFFLKNVAPNLFESCKHCEVFYEEWSFSSLYELFNNEFVEVRKGSFCQEWEEVFYGS